MSAFFFCAACGHDLTFIPNRRLKCYGCGKYYTENFICRCPRNRAFKFSAEILAPNKVKCHFCGRGAQVAASLEPPYRDKYRGGAGSGGLGSWDGQVSSFQRPGKARQKPKLTSKSERVTEIEKPEVDYVSEDQIVIMFPGHNSLDQIRCEISSGVLEVQSLLVDFLEKFPLPDFPIHLETKLRNAILDIRLKKKN